MKKLLIACLVLIGTGCGSADNHNEPPRQAAKADTPSTTTPIAASKQLQDTLKESIATFLRQHYKKDIESGALDTNSRKFVVAAYDLNNDTKKEVFVGLTGSYFCGSGGCTLLLLNSDQQLINSFTVVNYPISVASTVTEGWKDLVLNSGGTLHLVKFKGTKYPSNPSIQPKVKEDAGAQNVILATPAADQWHTF